MSKTKLIFPVVVAAGLLLIFPASSRARNSSIELRTNPSAPVQPVDEKSMPTVAILLFDRVQIIDVAGPWEVFGGAGYKVFTVAERTDPVISVYGQRMVADYTFANSPRADVLLVPGGITSEAVANPRLIKWVQDNARNSTQVMSVCTGAFILAKAGLLDGLSATTVRSGLELLQMAGNNIKVVYDKRYVDNGKIITTAGLSSGIDGALYLVSKITGKAAAQRVALFIEYNWDPDGKFVRAAFADRYLPNFQVADRDMISTDGDADRWEIRALIARPASTAEIIEFAQKRIVSETPHKSSAVVITKRAITPNHSEIEYKFSDDQGRPWRGVVTVDPAAEMGKFNLIVKILRS